MLSDLAILPPTPPHPSTHRISTNPCEVKGAKCDGVTFECPDNEPVEDGTTCKW